MVKDLVQGRLMLSVFIKAVFFLTVYLQMREYGEGMYLLRGTQ